MKTSGRLLTAVSVGLVVLLTSDASAQLADYIWNPANTGPQAWQLDTNWTAPTFPGGYPYTIPTPAFPNDPGRVDTDSNGATVDPTDGVAYPSVGANLSGVGANLNVDVGASNVTVASLNMGGTSSGVSTTVSSTGGKLVFENYEVNLTAAAFNPQVCAFDCGAAQITSGGVAGAINTISAPIQINGERLEFSAASTNNLTISGPITFLNYAAATNGQQFTSIRSMMPAGTKATISGSISLVDTVSGAGTTLALQDPGSIPPSPPTTTSIQNNPATGTLEISGVIQDNLASGAPFGGITIGTTNANQALSTVILSGINTFRGTTTLNRANLVLANDSALGVDSTVGDDRSGGASFAGNQNPSGAFGFNIMSDIDTRTISIDARISQWLTITGTHSLTWAGLFTQGNNRGIDNLLPAGKVFTISGVMYGSSIAGDVTAVENRIFIFDGTGTTVTTGGWRDKIKGGVAAGAASGLGHYRKAGTGTVLVSDSGGISDFTGDVMVDQGVMRFSSDAIFDQARYVNSTGGAIGVDTGTFTNSTLLQKLDAMGPGLKLNHGGLMLTAGEAANPIDFTAGDLAPLVYMSVAAPQNGINYTGTITPSTDPATSVPTYRLGGGNGVLTLPNNQLTGARNVQITNGSDVQLSGANSYAGVTRIQAKYHTTTQNQAIANTASNISNVVYEGTTLSVNTLLNGGVNSSIGSSTSDASNLVIQGSTLKYVGSGVNGTSNRLFTVGTGGATLDASGASGSVMSFTNTGALAMGLAGPQSGSSFDTGNNISDGVAGTFSTRSRVNVQNLDDIIAGPGTTGMMLYGPGVLSAGSNITAVNQPNPVIQNFQVTIATSNTNVAETGTITFGGVARTLTLAGSNSDNNTLSPLIADAAAALGTNTVNVAKSGTGKWILTGNNTYSGTTTVNAGTLLINGTQTGTGVTTVAAGATLGGTGTLGGALTNNGTISPGASVGTLSVLGNVTDGANSIWSIELSGASADKLAVTGNIDLSAVDTLNVTGAGSGTSWLIGTYTGTLTGVFDTITSGYAVTYTGGNITLSTGGCAPGDLNCDGHNDARDYVFWRKTGLPVSSYNAWRANYGTPPGSGAGLGGSAVPEPSCIVLIGMALLATIGGVRRRG